MKARFVFETLNEISIIHVTSPKISEIIKIEGFNPKQTINYKYYSKLGYEGIYFYDNLRQSQIYSYFLANKLNIKEVALIFCKVPYNICIRSNNIEDGIFIKNENLGKIKIEIIKIQRPSIIY